VLILNQTSLFTPFKKLASNPLIRAFAQVNRATYSHALHQPKGIVVGNGDAPAPAFWKNPFSDAEVDEILAQFRNSGISKYNCHLSQNPSLPKGVLVVDQTRGDALYRKKKSCFDPNLFEHPRVSILPNGLSLTDTLKIAKKVYVATSLLGMEALIHKLPVITYGWNFYAGWGLTEDRAVTPRPPRKTSLTLEQLFHAVYLRYTHYFHPDSKEPTSLAQIIKHIQLQHQQWIRHQQPFTVANLSPWKLHVLPKFTFPNRHSTEASSKVYTWGKKEIAEEHQAKDIVRIEDGFIRSRGLGANFNFPQSWVFDDKGIYFDATAPSRLEDILQNQSFPAEAEGKRIILVPGQVDSDASITYGSPNIRNNRELIAEVKKLHPDAYSWIQTVDEIHTLTSTVGFEALLHQKTVFTYGLPFYANWGLTQDSLTTERRTRKLTLDSFTTHAPLSCALLET